MPARLHEMEEMFQKLNGTAYVGHALQLREHNFILKLVFRPQVFR
jgi:hypothetical protein